MVTGETIISKNMQTEQAMIHGNDVVKWREEGSADLTHKIVTVPLLYINISNRWRCNAPKN